jgi:Xaa-Pro aminopeptidase
VIDFVLMLNQLRQKLAALELDGLWVAKPENIRYLSGFTSPKDAKVLVTMHEILLYTDSRYTAQARLESKIPFETKRYEEVPEHAKQFTAGKKIGFESDAVLYSSYEELQKGLEAASFSAVKDVIEPLRAIKTQEEIATIKKAAQIADRALESLLPLKAGVRELEVALELEVAMRRMGAQATGFEIIVASGERSAMPHGVASSRTLQDGDLVTVDWGALVDGYHSDCTRAFPIGEVSDKLRQMYNAVLEANLLAIAQIKAGAGCLMLDGVARDHLKAQGFETEFAHSLGHGVGLAIHEAPRLSFRATEQEVLETGNVVTVEPGLYIEGFGGVRIEDLVVVTESGYEVLTGLPKPRL